MFKVGIGQDSHRFGEASGNKPLLLGGLVFESALSIESNSDGDVVLHALTNAVSGITGFPVLGKITDKMCREGITNSSEYLAVAMGHLRGQGYLPAHVSISIECSTPMISPKIPEMQKALSGLLSLNEGNIGITATSGEGLTDFGRGKGVQVFCIVTAVRS